MAANEVIDITSDDDNVIPANYGHSDSDDDGGPSTLERRAIFTPIITRIANALGGYSPSDPTLYVPGDELAGCLKDLKKLWRKDDVDDDRTVARIFWETRLLPNDLVPILLVTAGRGAVEDKRAVATVDLMTAMTWPIDVAEELKELDEELDKGADYTQLVASHQAYKAALLRPGVMKALLGIMLAPLAKPIKERTERDGQVMNVVLHLVRNLAFIKDPPADSLGSADRAEMAGMQSKLVRVLEETKFTKLLLTIAANTDDDPLFNGWNTLVLEIFYLLFRGIKPDALARDQAKEPTANLQRLLAMEDRTRREVARKASSRHSRFGTTISVRLNANKTPTNPDSVTTPASGSAKQLVLHRQAAIHAETASIMDLRKKQKARKAATLDAIAQDHNLSVEARVVLKGVAGDFLEGCFNAFLGGLLKDIRSERAKITEKDHLRLLYITKWFLEYFLLLHASKSSTTSDGTPWDFGYIAEITDRVWVVWVLKRMREAMEAKPKAWTELQAGVEVLTQVLGVVDRILAPPASDDKDAAPVKEVPEDILDAADLLQQQLVYNGEVLDVAVEALRGYREGTQSLAYLDASVQMAYVLLRMLERWGKMSGDGMYVRRKNRRKKARKGKGKGVGENEDDEEGEGEDEEKEDMVDETIFTFEAFESKFANADVAQTLLTYLARWKEFAPGGEQMKRVVGLMHRIAIKAKAEGVFFKVSTLDLFKSILAEQKTLPREQAYKDLVNLINFVLRKFFKALEAEPFLAVEAFFPKNRGHWKAYSSWEPEKKKGGRGGEGGGGGGRGGAKRDNPNSTEVVVKKGYSFTEQMGIAIAALVDSGKKGLVDWTREILKSVIDKRKRIVDETDRKADEDDDDTEENPDEELARLQGQPSAEAISKFEDEVVPYLSNDHAEAATKNVHLKLLFRLCKFYLREEENADEDDELEWYIPQGILPSELEQCYNVIGQFLETPFDLGGKKASELLQKKRKKRAARRRRSPSGSDAERGEDEEDAAARKRRKKKEKEQIQYKSAQFIEDSDEEYGDMDAFLEKEKALREKAALAALEKGDTSRPIGMKATGTKKRRKRKTKDDAGDDGAPGALSEDVGGSANTASPTRVGGSGSGGRASPGSDSKGSDTDEDDADVHGDDSESDSAPQAAAKTAVPRPRPRPKPRRRKSVEESDASSSQLGDGDVEMAVSTKEDTQSGSPGGDEEGAVKATRRVKRLVLSDSEEE